MLFPCGGEAEVAADRLQEPLRVDLAAVGAVAVRRDGDLRRQTGTELEGENARLKKQLGEAELDKAMLRELSDS